MGAWAYCCILMNGRIGKREVVLWLSMASAVLDVALELLEVEVDSDDDEVCASLEGLEVDVVLSMRCGSAAVMLLQSYKLTNEVESVKPVPKALVDEDLESVVAAALETGVDEFVATELDVDFAVDAGGAVPSE